MGVSVYNWGQSSGGSGSGGTPTAPSSATYGPPEQFEGTLTETITITFSSATKSLTIQNTDGENPLEYSLNGGTTWVRLDATGEVTQPFQVINIQLRPVSGSPTYLVEAALSS